ncbi:LysR family transcriptional regulator [Enterovibrio sp. ZSDZ35]|uniref:LysR family transcriptional regulator n=1 Tax=Enterovibrio qingdaonensis TaxID=2899818 RepID=A0ABT5QG29_9GAMM|nr:LysR family transcriptional regulator [Enterovibrio sp. ZSDZ35]MDD1779935.1 LysR family transcriptional regulator [Enterovibrio sp. ZSDZ35]
MNLTHLESFLHVAKQGSFSAAADALNVSKGLISRHVKALESDLACTLFHRTTRTVTLTEAGEALLEKARKIELLALEASKEIEDLTQDNAGTIRFTAPAGLGDKICETMVATYAKKYPNVNIVLDFDTDIKDVEFGGFDIALRAHDDLPDNLVARRLGSLKNVLVASPTWLKQHPIHTPNDLLSLECIQSCFVSSWNNWLLMNDEGTELTIQTQGKLSCSTYAGTMALTLANLGVANLPLHVVEEQLAQGHLVQVLPSWRSRLHNLHVIYAKQRFYPIKLRDFIDTVMAWRNTHSHWFIEGTL